MTTKRRKTKLLEHLCCVEAASHYAHRFGKSVDDPHVLINVASNWHIFAGQTARMLDELTKLGVQLPEEIG